MAIKVDRRKDRIEDEAGEKISEVLKEYKDRKGTLIAALQEAQKINGYLSRNVMIKVAYELNIPLAEIYSVASFYSMFSTEPVGQTTIEVCMGTACYVKGANEILKKLRKDMGIKAGEVTPDGKFNIVAARCVGACSCAPVVKVGDDLKGNIDINKLHDITEQTDSYPMGKPQKEHA